MRSVAADVAGACDSALMAGRTGLPVTSVRVPAGTASVSSNSAPARPPAGQEPVGPAEHGVLLVQDHRAGAGAADRAASTGATQG